MRFLILVGWVSLLVCWLFDGCPEPAPRPQVEIAAPVKHVCGLCKGKCCMKCDVEDKCCCKHADKCPCPPDSRRP